MRYVGAILLGLLGIGVFPFNVHVLGTLPGLLLAGTSALLLFFAVRLGAPGTFGGLSAGSALTNLTSAFEEIERTRRTHPIGAGGGFDSLPKRRQAELERKIPKWLEALRSQSPRSVTTNLLKNMEVAQQFDRRERMQAQAKLLERLVQEAIAANPDVLAADHGVGTETRQPQPAPARAATRSGTGTSAQEAVSYSACTNCGHRLPMTSTECSKCRAAVGPYVSEATQPASAGLAGDDATFDATPNMPDIAELKPVSAFWVGKQCVMFHKDPPPLAKRLGVDLPLTYLYSASVYDPKARTTSDVFTLETGFTDDLFLCRLDRTGKHDNLGEGRQLKALPVFEAAVLNLVCAAAGLRPETARRIAV